jgi:putative ABC transport system permease protein
MVSLARKSLIHGWRSFMPAVLAIGFASLLLLMQAALVLGIFGSASVYVTGSDADVWIGYPGTQSVDQGRAIDANISALLQMDPRISRFEPFLWLDGDWHGANNDTGGVSVYVSGIDTRVDGLMFSKVLPRELRTALTMPDAVVVDRAELGKLGVRVGGRAFLNGHPVQVVGVASGLRALGGVNVVASLDTARRLDVDSIYPDWPTYFVAKLRDGTQADSVVERLDGHAGFGRYHAWTADNFARRSILFWLFDTGAGAGVLFLAGIVFLVGAVISSQTLVAAVVGSVREYATLNALGVGMSALRWVVLEQAFWVGTIGVIGAIGLGALLIALARLEDVPVVFNLQISLACVLVVMALAAVSGMTALGGLRRADPGVLLR